MEKSSSLQFFTVSSTTLNIIRPGPLVNSHNHNTTVKNKLKPAICPFDIFDLIIHPLGASLYGLFSQLEVKREDIKLHFFEHSRFILIVIIF
ncbi:hypothetical protein DSUL_170033 [Desulfovibrionales bacterium]